VRDEKLVRAELMAAFAGDCEEHRLHPALLDTVTAAVRAPGEGSYIPFLYRRMVVHADLPANIFGHVRRRSSGPDTAVGDVDIFDPAGTMLVSIEGFTMRRADFSDGWDRTTPATLPAEVVAGQPRETSARRSGMDPAEGLRLLTRLLETRTPSSVLVRPYVDGSPLTVARTPAAPAPAVAAPQPAQALSMSAPVVPQKPVAAAPAPADTGTRLRELWTQALGSAPAHDQVDFFDSGGDSLAAVELMARIRASFGIELSIGLLLDLRTFDALRQVVQDNVATGEASSAAPGSPAAVSSSAVLPARNRPDIQPA
jgi:phthiocerol/phenolphthiocerol synthesis type-I polyketide synthase E